MNNMDRLHEWHAIFVVTGDEDNVRERLKYRFGDQYGYLVSKRELREIKGGIWLYNIRLLFSGYVLLDGLIDVIKAAMAYRLHNGYVMV